MVSKALLSAFLQEFSHENDEVESPLEFSYTFSFFKRPAGIFKPEEYGEYVQPLATFHTAEQFWKVYSFLRRPCELGEYLRQEKTIDIHLFKKGIKPVWEVC